MKKLLNIKTILLGVMLLSVAGCSTKPTDGVKVTIDMNILKYSMLVRVTDASFNVVAGTTMTITGTNASSIYEISGKKVFTVTDGNITLGLDPAFSIAAGNATFNINVTAPGYKTTTYAATFTSSTLQQSINLSIVLTASASTGGTATPPVPVTTTTHFVLDATGTCANKSNLNVRPSIYLFFRDHATPTAPYLQLGYMDAGHLETNYLAVGKTYDFQMTYGGTSYLVTQSVDQTAVVLNFNMGDSICSSF